MPAINDDTLLPFSLPGLGGKKVSAGSDGGTISPDRGVILVAGADKRLRLIRQLAALIPDRRKPDDVTHTMADQMRARVFAIACGYPDANDLDTLRKNPAFKPTWWAAPDSGDEAGEWRCGARYCAAPGGCRGWPVFVDKLYTSGIPIVPSA